MKIPLCTYDMLFVFPRFMLPLEEQIIARLKRGGCELIPTDFTGIDIEQYNGVLHIIQQSYIKNLPRPDCYRIFSMIGILCKSLSPKYPTSEPAFLFALASSALQKTKNKKLSSITYVPLDFNSIHIREHTNGANQNLEDKHSQIGFVVTLFDQHRCFNIIL